MKRCKACDKSYTHKDTYCAGCGKMLEDYPMCRHCNEEIHPFDKFCSNCGRPCHDAKSD